MKYTFYTSRHDIYDWKYLNVKFENSKYKILMLILLSDDWTPSKVQEIIDGIEESKEKPKGEEYRWANEDVLVIANKNGILLIDMMAQRGGVHDPDKITLALTHEELLSFLEDFKEFVAENS